MPREGPTPLEPVLSINYLTAQCLNYVIVIQHNIVNFCPPDYTTPEVVLLA